MIQPIAWLLSQRLFWAVLAVVVGPAVFVRGFRRLQRKRLIMDIPRSPIRTAALGPIEILKIEASDRREDNGKLGLARAGLPCGRDAEFLEEHCIRPGDQLFVLGDLQENPWAKRDESSELSRIGPGFVSEDEADRLRQEVFPPAREGNSGRNGCPGTRVRLSSCGDSDERPRSLRDSTKPRREIVAELGWECFLSVWGGPAAALRGWWEILSHAKATGILQGNF